MKWNENIHQWINRNYLYCLFDLLLIKWYYYLSNYTIIDWIVLLFIKLMNEIWIGGCTYGIVEWMNGGWIGKHIVKRRNVRDKRLLIRFGGIDIWNWNRKWNWKSKENGNVAVTFSSSKRSVNHFSKFQDKNQLFPLGYSNDLFSNTRLDLCYH